MFGLWTSLAVWPPYSGLAAPEPADGAGWKIVLLIALAIALMIVCARADRDEPQSDGPGSVIDVRWRRGRRAG